MENLGVVLMIDRTVSLDAVRGALHKAQAPIFVGRVRGESSAVLEVGTLERRGAADIRRRVTAALDECGVRMPVVVRHHSARGMARARSLESLLARTGTGRLVLDQTKAISRAESVVFLANALRRKLGEAMTGAYFDTTRRTFYLLVSRTASKHVVDGDARQALVSAAESAWSQVDGGAFGLALRIGYSLPAGADVVAIDRATSRAMITALMRRPMFGKLGAALLGTLAGATITLPAGAADLVVTSPARTAPASAAQPAVDEPNFSIATLAGVARDPVMFDHLWAGLQAKATVPLGDRFGGQLDLGLASDQYYGAALHLFARDPAMGLVGIVGSAESQYGVTMNRIGAELEYYVTDNLTVAARVGYQTGSAPSGAYGRLDVKFYPDPNLALTGGAELQPSFAIGRAGVEWRPAIDGFAGLSVSADAMATSTGDYRAMFGLHFQIGGGSQTLVDRDRKSDPSSAIFNTIDVSSAVPKGYAGPTTPPPT